MIRIRPATSDDADAMALINAELQSLHAEQQPDWFKPELENPQQAMRALVTRANTFVFVAERAEHIIGYAAGRTERQAATAHKFPQEQLYIDQIGVLSSTRRSGTGSALLAAIRTLAQERGVKRIALDTWAFNEAAQAFFKAEGFEPYNVRLWQDV